MERGFLCRMEKCGAKSWLIFTKFGAKLCLNRDIAQKNGSFLKKDEKIPGLN